MHKWLVALALPAMAILAAALVQMALTKVWPGVQHLPSVAVTVDSYFAVLLTTALCFVAGRWLRRNIRTRGAIALASVAPSIFTAMILTVTLRPLDHVAWSSPLTQFVVISAVLPLLAVLVGWGATSSHGARAGAV